MYAIRGTYAAPNDPIDASAVANEALSHLASSHVSDSVLMANLVAANFVSSKFNETLVYNFRPESQIEDMLVEDEFCTTVPGEVYIADGGAKRGLIRDSRLFVEGSTRPCPFNVRGVDGNSFTPSFIGTARVPILTDTGDTHYLLMRDTIHVPDCPHDILCPGRLCWAGCCFYLAPGKEHSYMRLPHGAFVSILNRGIIFLPKPACTAAEPAPTGSDPYMPSFLRKSAQTCAATATVVDLPVAQCNQHRQVAFWCSGDPNLTPSLQSEWLRLNGGPCHSIDRMRGYMFDLLRDELVDE